MSTSSAHSKILAASISIIATGIAITVVLLVLNGQTSPSDVHKWVKSGQTHKIQTALTAEVLEFKNAQQNDPTIRPDMDLIKSIIEVSINHNLKSVRNEIESIMITSFKEDGKYRNIQNDHFILGEKICDAISIFNVEFQNLPACLNAYFDIDGLPDSYKSTLARSDESILYNGFAAKYRDISDRVAHGTSYKVEISREQLALCLKYASISEKCRTRVNRGILVLDRIISDCNLYHQNQQNLSGLYTQVSEIKSEQNLDNDKLREVKDKRSKIRALNGFMVGRYLDGRYEIASNEGRAILITSTLEFTSRGAFSIPVIRLNDETITLKEDHGGFRQQWPVYLQVPADYCLDEIRELEGNLASRSRNLANANSLINKIHLQQKALESMFSKEIDDSKWPFDLNQIQMAYYETNRAPAIDTGFQSTHISSTSDTSDIKTEFEKSDSRLNSVYNEIRSKLTAQERLELRRIQREWLKHRNAQCGASPDDFTNVRPSDELYRKWITMQDNRTAELQRMYPK